jgi:hypothetical protein
MANSGGTVAKAKRITLKGVNDAWKACEPFQCNNSLSGEFVTAVWGETMGRLNEDESSEMRRWCDMARIAPGARFFVVYSYATPIAWAIVYNNGEVERYKVTQRFSVTTSKHSGWLY